MTSSFGCGISWRPKIRSYVLSDLGVFEDVPQMMTGAWF